MIVGCFGINSGTFGDHFGSNFIIILVIIIMIIFLIIFMTVFMILSMIIYSRAAVGEQAYPWPGTLATSQNP